MNQLKAQRVIVLWMLITIGMLLHQFMGLHNLRFGVNVLKSGYDGVPDVEMIKRLTLYVLPLLYISVSLYVNHKVIRLLHLIASPFYLGFHTLHFIDEWGKMKDPVQWVLLTALVIMSALLVHSSWSWFRDENS